MILHVYTMTSPSGLQGVPLASFPKCVHFRSLCRHHGSMLHLHQLQRNKHLQQLQTRSVLRHFHYPFLPVHPTLSKTQKPHLSSWCDGGHSRVPLPPSEITPKKRYPARVEPRRSSQIRTTSPVACRISRRLYMLSFPFASPLTRSTESSFSTIA